jgi:hypothetical protein
LTKADAADAYPAYAHASQADAAAAAAAFNAAILADVQQITQSKRTQSDLRALLCSPLWPPEGTLPEFPKLAE